MIDMGIEEIDDNSSQEDRPPPTTTTATIKKRPRSKSKNKETHSPAIASVASGSGTLTRFLGPAGPPSLPAWEDVNRQCPVCQQTGFSSRSLALHVNECLDVVSNAGARAGAGGADEAGEAAAAATKETTKKRVGITGGRNAATPDVARRAGKGGASTGNMSNAAGAGSREGEGVTRTAPQAVPMKRKAPASNEKAAKKPPKTQQDGREAAAERQGPGVWLCILFFW